MAEGRAEPRYYLCSVDPGVGKSTAIIQWLKVFLKNPEGHGDAGVLIMLERYDEIERFIADSGIAESDYAVFVTDAKANLNGLGIGKTEADRARVLFTTKAQIRLRAQGKPFHKAAPFFYRGTPRAVKIWDESMLLGRSITLDRAEIGGLLGTLGKKNVTLMEQVEQLMTEIRALKDGESCRPG